MWHKANLIRDKKAYSVIELVLAMLIVGIILAPAINWIFTMNKETLKTREEAMLNEQARTALALITSDMRRSDYTGIKIYDPTNPILDLELSPTVNLVSSVADNVYGRKLLANHYWYEYLPDESGNPSCTKGTLYRYPDSVNLAGLTDKTNYVLLRDLYNDGTNNFGFQIILLKKPNDSNIQNFKIILNLKKMTSYNEPIVVNIDSFFQRNEPI